MNNREFIMLKDEAALLNPKIRFIQRVTDVFTFIKALIKNPRATGAILPSSNRLAKEMASHVSLKKDELIVELGAGTGVVTGALIAAGIHPSKIIAIECSPILAKKLCERYPGVQVIEGDAAELLSLLGNKSAQVKTVISGLPLRSLSKVTAQTILHQISNLLISGGKYIQFTYQYKQNLFFSPICFKRKSSKMIWRNMPPARVDVFEV